MILLKERRGETNLKTVAVNISKKLPKQLQSDCFGFVKLSGKTKKPFEKEWQNKPYTYEGIQSWIEKGHNYGVLGGHGDLVVIDADTNEIDKVVKDELPPTFTVRTPLKGHHYYYIVRTSRINRVEQR
jgi:hypothetical protein